MPFGDTREKWAETEWTKVISAFIVSQKSPQHHNLHYKDSSNYMKEIQNLEAAD